MMAINRYFFTWTVENFSSCVEKTDSYISSPSFKIDGFGSEEWLLKLFPRGRTNSEKYISFYLRRRDVAEEEEMYLSFKLQIGNSEGFDTFSKSHSNLKFVKNTGYGFGEFLLQKDIYVTRRKEFLADDCLIVRAEIWKPDGNLPSTRYAYGRTRMHKETISSTYVFEKFSSFTPESKKTISLPEENQKMTVSLSHRGSLSCKEILNIEVVVMNSHEYKLVVASVSFLNSESEKVVTVQDEIWMDSMENGEAWSLPCHLTKEMLLKNGFLKDDALKISMEFVCCKGIAYEAKEINLSESQRKGNSDLSDFRYPHLSKGSGYEKPELLNNLSNDLHSISQDNIFSDITLQSDLQSFQVHRILLSARSPVFKAMFTSNMKESVEKTIKILDVDADTLKRMLNFFYTDCVGELTVESAQKLYFAADKYQVQLLKQLCCEFLLKNISVTNVCDFLLLSYMHQDTNFKSCVLDFLGNNSCEVMETETWKSFMKSNGNIAAEAMYQILTTKPISEN